MKARNKALVLAGAALIVGAAVAAKQAGQVRQRMQRSYGRWQIVTVNRDAGDINLQSKELRPLLDLGDDVAIRIRPAPRGDGAEIAARLGQTAGSSEARARAARLLARLRQALRDVQQLVETGELLQPDVPAPARPAGSSWWLGPAGRFARAGGHT